MKNRTSFSMLWLSGFAVLFLACGVHAQTDAQSSSKEVLVEEIIARVNNQIITLSDYQKAAQGLAEEVRQDCQNCTQDQLQAEMKDRQKNLLRDMIDQQLLIERAKDMNIDVETDLVKRLDEVRKENNLATMEDLEKAVEKQGIVWEDYKQQMRNGLLTQKVIQQEVGGRMDIGPDEIKKYYDAHKQDFNRPEQVDLSEIFLNTEGKTPDEIAAIKTKADDLHKQLVNGNDFAETAKRHSEGSTAADGGELGTFERGQLAPQLESVVFKMDRNGITDVIQTKTGFEILKVNEHFQAGLQPLDKVSDQITNILYKQKMDPAMRDYLAELREESYVTVKPGFTDTAAVPGATVIQEVAPTPDTAEKKKGKHKVPLPKASGL
ncbi:MAG TPA: peptidylprolyl isomerase [Candidatus Baltobacteraceae bacterium]|jgi:peptidyl-prolyl cis-trans isomerase SurA|nr:peptidylprolyl isomerase [Candidatus Baltobacteraceae bacterium]